VLFRSCFSKRQSLSGISGDVYTSAVGPTAVTVFVQKVWDSIAKKL
jgi:hypothetical protein